MNTNNNTKFSLFGYGYRNNHGEAVLQTRPKNVTDILSVYKYITSGAAKNAQDTLRGMRMRASKEECSDFKKMNFQFATFRGIFSSRKASALTMLSPYIVIDIDGLPSNEVAQSLVEQLSGDVYVETALAFVSPSGLGVKWVVEIPEWLQGESYKEQYLGLCRHVVLQYGYEPDWGCSDVCRACFLGYDDKCFINNKFLNDEQKN